MKTTFLIGFLLMAIVCITMAEMNNAEDAQAPEEERGYCAQKGIKCHDIHCCSGLKCVCNSSRSSCVCKK
nr:Tb_85 precursor [Tibellus oblongus]